jgi:predicted AlkP superfamily pyrophosphatase or phosphodiesterase
MMSKQENKRNSKAVISILIDALGWEIVKKYGAFSGLAPFQTGIRTILGFSSSAVPTVLAGISGDKMERWNSVYYSPATSPFRWLNWIKWLPEPLKENRYSRFLIRHLSKRMAGHKGYFSDFAIPVKFLPQFDLCEKRNIYSPGGLIGNQSIFDDLERMGKPYRVYSYVENSTDENIFSVVKKDISATETTIFYLYLCQLDAFLHNHVHEQTLVEQKVRWYEGKVTDLIEHAKTKFDDVVLHIFSDHGMVPTQATVNLIEKVSSLGFSEGNDFIAMYDSTMARFWFKSERCQGDIVDMLNEQDCGNIVSEETLREEGAYFADHRFGEVIFLMKPGILICPSYMSYTPVRGMHGFSPDDPGMEASYLSNFEPEQPPAHIIDIKRTILKTIGN